MMLLDPSWRTLAISNKPVGSSKTPNRRARFRVDQLMADLFRMVSEDDVNESIGQKTAPGRRNEQGNKKTGMPKDCVFGSPLKFRIPHGYPGQLPSTTPATAVLDIWLRVGLSTRIEAGSTVGFGGLHFQVGTGKPLQLGCQFAGRQSAIVVISLDSPRPVADYQAKALGDLKFLGQTLAGLLLRVQVDADVFVGQDFLNPFCQISFPVEAFLAGANEDCQGLLLFLGEPLSGPVIPGPDWVGRRGGDEIGKCKDSH